MPSFSASAKSMPWSSKLKKRRAAPSRRAARSRTSVGRDEQRRADRGHAQPTASPRSGSSTSGAWPRRHGAVIDGRYGSAGAASARGFGQHRAARPAGDGERGHHRGLRRVVAGRRENRRVVAVAEAARARRASRARRRSRARGSRATPVRGDRAQHAIAAGDLAVDRVGRAAARARTGASTSGCRARRRARRARAGARVRGARARSGSAASASTSRPTTNHVTWMPRRANSAAARGSARSRITCSSSARRGAEAVDPVVAADAVEIDRDSARAHRHGLPPNRIT